ncbi:MAG: alpha/beta hydrolase [Myxococcales bacterium]
MRYYCEDTLETSDGARLWYALMGEGSPAIALCDGLGCDGVYWRHLLPQLCERHRVVHFQYRGHGRSGLPEDPKRVGVGFAADDLDAVLAATGIDRAVVLGHSMGVQVLFEFHRRHPERVLGLVPICGAYGNALDTVHDDTNIKLVFPLVHKLAGAMPKVAHAFTRAVLPTELSLQYALTFEVNRALAPREDMQAYFEHLARMDPMVFLDTLKSAAEHTAWDHLSKIDVPTLIVAGDHDRFTPLWLSQRMHRAIPGSELLVVRSGTHTAPIEHPELIALRIRRFLKERIPSAA